MIPQPGNNTAPPFRALFQQGENHGLGAEGSGADKGLTSFALWARLPYHGTMKLRISFCAEPSGPDVLPLPLNYPLGDYDSVEQARKIAFTDGDRPGSRVHSIIIESVDGGAINERWIRWADGWRPADV